MKEVWELIQSIKKKFDYPVRVKIGSPYDDDSLGIRLNCGGFTHMIHISEEIILKGVCDSIIDEFCGEFHNFLKAKGVDIDG